MVHPHVLVQSQVTHIRDSAVVYLKHSDWVMLGGNLRRDRTFDSGFVNSTPKSRWS